MQTPFACNLFVIAIIAEQLRSQTQGNLFRANKLAGKSITRNILPVTLLVDIVCFRAMAFKPIRNGLLKLRKTLGLVNAFNHRRGNVFFGGQSSFNLHAALSIESADTTRQLFKA
jgi:hypothetical protein